jgi:sugar lactone lactonase YvrE
VKFAPHLLALTLTLAGCQTTPNAGKKPDEPGRTPYPASYSERAGGLEVVHEFTGPLPTGITVSQDGRVFVSFPRWEDQVPATVAEIRDGREVPYPNADVNRGDTPDRFLSVQSVVVDPRNRLWAVDSGSVDMGPIRGPEWPKLVCIDLASNQVVRTIRFPQGVISDKSFINDVRFDLRRGAEGMAFVTDSSAQGANGIIVVDLATGASWRRLSDHPSVKADRTFAAVLEGEPLMLRRPGQPPKPALLGSDGIAISPDGSRLFYCPLSSRRLHSVSVDALADRNRSDAQVADTVRDEGTR